VGVIGLAAACGHFHQDQERNLARIATMVGHAREAGAQVLVLPHATLGGYVDDPAGQWPDAPTAAPEGLRADDPVFDQVAALAREMVVCLGYTEIDDGRLYSTAVCLDGDGVLGRHRKLHLPPGEAVTFREGDRLAAFDTPIGRMGMLVDYDKTFPETARSLALDGAAVLAILSAWPASVTRRAATLVHDRQTRLFDLYDQARAAENQVVVLSSNQSGGIGRQRFVGSAKVVGPGGEVLASTGARGGLAVAALDVAHEVERARRVLFHLKERRPDVYGAPLPGAP
jgi:predicted amidohydrolase